MALRDILAAIERDGEDRIREIESDSDRKAAALIEHAAAEAASRRESAAHALDARTAREVDRIVNQAHLVGDRALRSARETLYGEARAEMMNRLARRRQEPDYSRLLERLLQESLAVLPNPVRVRCDPRDTDLINRLLQNLALTQIDVQADLATIGGLDVGTDDGRTIRNTLEVRAAKADRHLRRLAGELLPVLRSGHP